MSNMIHTSTRTLSRLISVGALALTLIGCGDTAPVELEQAPVQAPSPVQQVRRQALTRGTPGAVAGSNDYCDDAAFPCQAGEGRCDQDSECDVGLVCVKGVGPSFGYPNMIGVCAPPTCMNSVQDGDEAGVDCGGSCGSCTRPDAYNTGHNHYCAPAYPCDAGEGDCDEDSHCQAGLVCTKKQGARFGYANWVSVCAPPTCTNSVQDGDETGPDCGGSCGSCTRPTDYVPGHDGYCHVSHRCGGAEGDCDADDECLPGLECLKGFGARFGYANWVSVCVPPTCSNGTRDEGEDGIDCGGFCGSCDRPDAYTPGHNHYCAPAYPCDAGGGDCDDDADCQVGLVCSKGRGAKFGYANWVSVCVPSHCSNSVQDGDEEGADCGGSCGSCDRPDLYEPGHQHRCSVSYPCGPQDGDCDSDLECLPGLECIHGRGPEFGFASNVSVCIAPECTNGAQDGDETGVDCGGSCGSCERPDAYTVGTSHYCDANYPCAVSAGDCDADSECLAGLVCDEKTGPRFGLSANVGTCRAPTCTNGVQDGDETGPDCGGSCGSCDRPAVYDDGHDHYCHVAYPCGAGEGDCDQDAHCQAGLTCIKGQGERFGYANWVSVCAPPTCKNGVQDGDETGPDCGGSCGSCARPTAYQPGHDDYCSIAYPCASGDGDCDVDADCQPGLACVKQKGALFGYADWVSVCAAPTCVNGVQDGDEAGIDCGGSCGSCSRPPSYDPGQASYCQAAFPCSAGQGDCDSDSECQPGLVCRNNEGPRFGFTKNISICMPETCRNGAQDGDETGADCGGSCGSCDRPATYNPGHTSYCQRAYPCEASFGDCDTDDECQAGLTCVKSRGAAFGYANWVSVCAPTHCTNNALDGDEAGLDCGGSCGECDASTGLTPGHNDYCSEGDPCEAGFGDCDSNNECDPGLVCVHGVGAEYGFNLGVGICRPVTCMNSVQDVHEDGPDCGGSCGACERPALYTAGHTNYCQQSHPCGAGEGDCDTNAECESGLVCIKNRGATFGYANNVSVCAPPSCQNSVQDGDETGVDCGGSCGDCKRPADYTPGHNHYCSPAYPCDAGLGDCDIDADCATGLECLKSEGARFGYANRVSVCVLPTCRNSVQDAGEEDVDCGGGCGECPRPNEYEAGHDDRCSTSFPCGPQDGDCDSDLECMPGLICVSGRGLEYGFSESTSVCVAPSCFNRVQDGDEAGPDCGGSCGSCDRPPEYAIGHEHYCSVNLTCPAGQGDCDEDQECDAGLECITGQGARFGYEDRVGVCAPPSCENSVQDGDETGIDCGGSCGLCTRPPAYTTGHDRYCAPSHPCGAGEGDCDADLECQAGLICLNGQGARYGYDRNSVSVCVPPSCTDGIQNGDETGPDCGGSCGSCARPDAYTLGHTNFCQVSYPCGAGQGDCDSDAECQPGLTCEDQRGALYGLSANVGVCTANTCSNGVQDGAEEDIDCGGECGYCPPVISGGPANVSVIAGESATFTVAATGQALAYQWTKDASPIEGATSPTYSVSDAQTSDQGSYAVTVSNPTGSVTSAPATLTVLAEAPPAITSQPADVSVAPGESATFSVAATGQNLTYQWFARGMAIDGAVSATYSIAPTYTDNGINYSVRVSNQAGSVTSRQATLQVLDTTAPTIVLSGTLPDATNLASVRVAGTVQDDQPGALHAVEVVSSRYPTIIFTATSSASGTFDVDVPLEPGPHTLTITAKDPAGNVSAPVTWDITRVVSAAPVVSINSPGQDLTTTSARIDVTGTIDTTRAESELIVTVAGQLVQVREDAEDRFAFTLADAALQLGPNVIVVEVVTPHETVTESVVVTRVAIDPGATQESLQIELVGGAGTRWVSDTLVSLSGVVTSNTCVNMITVAGQPPAQQSGLLGQSVSFSTSLTIPDPTAAFDVAIVATGCDGGTSTATVTYRVDEHAPVITFDADSSQTLAVLSSPYRLTGMITDSNLVGASLGGQELLTRPGANDGEWIFEANVTLDRGAATPLVVEAWDQAGMRSSATLSVRYDADTSLSFTSPAHEQTLALESEQESVSFVLQATPLAATDLVQVRLEEGGSWVPLSCTDSRCEGQLDLDTDRDYVVDARVVDASDTVLATASVKITTIDERKVPFELLTSAPANYETGVESNQPINVSFNREIDFSELRFEVRETVSGYVYRTADSNADLRSLSKVTRVKVEREREVVPGTAQNLPGNRSFVFYPEREFTYGASVFVDVIYSGVSIARFRFEVRSIPTLVHGFVTSARAIPLEGVKVSLPDLGYETTTNRDGSFNFGWGWPADKLLPPGRHKLLVNIDDPIDGYHGQVRWLEVYKGEINTVGRLTLAAIDVSEGQAYAQAGGVAVLAGGDVNLDFSKVTDLRSPRGTPGASLSLGIEDLGQVGYQLTTPTLAGFGYVFDPPGVSVAGAVDVTIDLPSFKGSYDYLNMVIETDDIPAMMWLVGLDRDSGTIRIKGVARIDKTNQTATADGIVFDKLDVMGLAVILPRHLGYAAQYLEGTLTLPSLCLSVEGQP